MSNKDVRRKPLEPWEKPDVVAQAASANVIRSVLLQLEQGLALLRPFVQRVESANGQVSACTAMMQVMVASHKQMLANLNQAGLLQYIVAPGEQEQPAEPAPEQPADGPRLVTD